MCKCGGGGGRLAPELAKMDKNKISSIYGFDLCTHHSSDVNSSLFVLLLTQSSTVIESVPVHLYDDSHTRFVAPVNVLWFVLVTMVFMNMFNA